MVETTTAGNPDSKFKYKRRAEREETGDSTVKRFKRSSDEEPKKKVTVLTKEDRKELRKKRKSEKKHAGKSQSLINFLETAFRRPCWILVVDTFPYLFICYSHL